MEPSSHSSAPNSTRPLPAWAFSLLFHSSVLVLLAVAVQDAPRGAGDEPGRGTGIVLKTASAEGDLYEGEETFGEENASEAEADGEQSTAELLAALPSNAADSQSQSDLPQLPTIGAGATEPGGQPNAGQFTTGGGKKGSPTGGGDTRVGFMGVEGTGNKFVYVLDRSSSMEGLPIAAAKRQLIQSLASLEDVNQFQVIFFNHEQQPFQIPGGGRRIAFGSDRNKQLAANFVGGITADGGTDRFTALKMAVLLQPDVIFFLTDADDPMSGSELAEIARLNRRGEATICTVHFGRGPKQRGNFLVDLAHQTGGEYVYVDTSKL